MTVPLPVLEPLPAHRRTHPSKLFVEVTTRCNLRCAMCVKYAPGQGLVEGDMSEETFERLAPAFPHLEALVLNGIGEPLLHRGLERFIERAKVDMPADAWVGFQTNGQLIGPRRAVALVAAGVDRIAISADALSPDRLRSIHGGARLAPIEAACSFLWHSFSCHLAGVAKTVRPLSFGNLADAGVLETWNGQPWRTFRGDVTRYDFPFCYDCNLAMCDYVEDGDFEQDCHLVGVPCAACLWCTGPFQCLR